MKLNKKNAEEFRPVVLEITFETLNELKTMQLVCSHATWIAASLNAAKGCGGGEIQEMIQEIGRKLKS